MKSDQQYYPQLDTLRTFAAFGVINLHWLHSSYPSLYGIDHSSNWGFGLYGVQLFFVLSGFLITDILIKQKDVSNKGHIVKNFYVRRVLRLFPIYYLFLVFLILVNDEFVKDNIAWFATYTSNFKFYASGGLIDVWSNHLWTLSIEEQFYLVFPLLILYVPRKFEISMPIVLIGSSLIFKTINGVVDGPMHLLTISQTDMLGAGVCLAIFKNRISNVFDSMNSLTAKMVMLVSLLACFGIYYFASENSLLWFAFNYLLVIAFSLLVAASAHGFRGVIGKVLNNQILRFLGKISYGLYLYHKVIPLALLIIFTKLGLRIENIFLYYIVNLAILLTVTYLSWIFIESPIMKMKAKFRYNQN